MTRERDESGQYVETVGPTAVVDVFETINLPFLPSSSLPSSLDCTTEAARQKLGTLVDEGTLGVRKTGRTRVYWRSDNSDA